MSYHRLPLLQSPLVGTQPHITPCQLPTLSQVESQNSSDPSAKELPQIETHDNTPFDHPQFQHYEATSNIQLFFDLFFVANLTSFTNLHEINSISALSSYVGYFSILWFTWCQVTLYDVRFSTDSIFQRIAHACHFGVMVGLAIVGPQFDDPKDTPWNILQQLSLILMASRAILLLQYGSTLFLVWKYHNARVPLMAVMASLVIAAILYLGISLSFSAESAADAYIAWYIIPVFEVAANIAMASRWHIVSFKGTHLTERMSCLTLIILGEGVIGLTKSIVKIEALDFSFSSGAIGSIISAVLLIYSIYMLYFDNIQLEHFGTICQQIWIFLHFIFYVALVLLMEGTNQLISWRHIIEYINKNFSHLLIVLESGTPNEQDVFNAWNSTIESVLSSGIFSVTQNTWDEIQKELALLSPASNSTDGMKAAAEDKIGAELFKAIFDGYGFEPPQTNNTSPRSFEDFYNTYYEVFALIFVYFFICAGLVLITLAVLELPSLLKGEGRESRLRYIGIISNFVLGTSLTLLSTMVLTAAADNLGKSMWTLPLPTLVLLILMMLNHFLRWLVRDIKEK